MAHSITRDAIPKVSSRRLIAMGLLTVWFPYVFVWFIQKPAYPRGFPFWLTIWATFWIGSAVLFFATNIAGLKPRG